METLYFVGGDSGRPLPGGRLEPQPVKLHVWWGVVIIPMVLAALIHWRECVLLAHDNDELISRHI